MEPSSTARVANLSPTKQLLLQKRLRGEIPLSTDLRNFTVLPRPQRIPLSYGQQRLWFLDQLEAGAGSEYNMPGAWRVRGKLDRKALERAINAIVDRHEILRTHFAEVDGIPEQVITSRLRIDIPLKDLTGLEGTVQQDRIMEVMRREWEQPFDLASGPVLRMTLLKLGERDHILLRTIHHIAWDAWSESIFNEEFTALYDAFLVGSDDPLKPVTAQYADFALWQREWLEGGALQEGLNYWEQQLRGIPPSLGLPTDRPRPAIQTFDADVCQIIFPSERVAGLERLVQDNQSTLYMTSLATLALVLSHYTGKNDIVVGSPIADRQDAQLEKMIGFFVNTIVMRVRIEGRMSFKDLLRDVRQTALEAYHYQYVPFEQVVRGLSPERCLDRTPVFEVLLELQNASWESQGLKGLEIEPVGGRDLRVRFDLEVHAWHGEGKGGLYWLYNRDLFDRWRIEQMARHYARVLTSAIADDTRTLDQLLLPTDTEEA